MIDQPGLPATPTTRTMKVTPLVAVLAVIFIVFMIPVAALMALSVMIFVGGTIVSDVFFGTDRLGQFTRTQEDQGR